MPYLLEEGETVRKPGSNINFYFNDIASIFRQPLQSGIGEIYTLPAKTGDFMGFPIYEHEGRETTAIYKGNEPLFLPVSQEEYLNALIKYEEQKNKENGSPISMVTFRDLFPTTKPKMRNHWSNRTTRQYPKTQTTRFA